MKALTHLPTARALVSLDVVRETLATLGLDKNSRLEETHGGLTSQVWRLSRLVGPDLIVKASHSDCGTPLYPNSASQEWRAMLSLSGSGLAPCPDSFVPLPNGWSLVVSHAVVEAKHVQAEGLAKLLAQIHAHAPWPGLPPTSLEPQSILDQSATMISADGMPKWLAHLKPKAGDPGKAIRRVIHRDLVPANVVATKCGVAVGLDWQCPALGDPCEDISHATSPAMQSLSQRHPNIGIEDVAEAYPDPFLRSRFYRMEPLYRWRMACYCLWKLRRGEDRYRAGLDMECAALEKARERSERYG